MALLTNVDSHQSYRRFVSRLERRSCRRGFAPAKAASAPEKDATWRGEGKVEAIANGEVTLSHGPIPDLKWPAMTMGFQLPPGGVPRNVSVGDTVGFAFRKTPDDRWQLTSIAPVAGAAASGVRP